MPYMVKTVRIIAVCYKTNSLGKVPTPSQTIQISVLHSINSLKACNCNPQVFPSIKFETKTNLKCACNHQKAFIIFYNRTSFKKIY